MSPDVIMGHERNLRFLRRAVSSGRISHAYLFYGPPGIGKATVARTLAGMLLCRRGDSGEACGVCEDCKLVARGQHPDLYQVLPSGATIRIEQVRALQQQLLRRPLYGRRQVCLMANAETMSTEAANCLLKTLEEPPGKTVFVLTSDRWHDLPPTVVSRCQRLRFDPLPPDAVALWLKEKHGVEEQKAGLLARLARGSPGRALDLATNPDLESIRRQVVQIARELPGMRVGGIMQRAASLAEGGREAVDFLIGMLLWWYRDLAVWRLTRRETQLWNREYAAELQAQEISTGGLLASLSAIMEARRQLRSFAPPRLVAEVLLLRLAQVAGPRGRLTYGETGSGRGAF